MQLRRVLCSLSVVLVLSGCSATPVAESSSAPVNAEASTTPTPTASSNPLIAEQPEALVSYDCAAAAAYFSDELPGVTKRDPRASERNDRVVKEQPPAVTDVDIVRNAGGSVCVYSNGQTDLLADASGAQTENPDYRGIEVWVLPNPGDALAGLNADHEVAVGCRRQANGPTRCESNVMVGANWVFVKYGGGPTTNAIYARMSSFVQTVLVEPTANSVDRAPGIAALPAACEDQLGAASAQALTGTTMESDETRAYARDHEIAIGALWSSLPLCEWYNDEFEVDVQAIPGGAWILPELLASGAVEELDLGAAAPDARAVYAVNPAIPLIAHVAVTSGGNLYEIEVWNPPAVGSETATRVAMAVLAQVAVPRAS